MTTPPAEWAEPDQRALLRSPLINVIWQVRFTPVPALADGRVALQYQQALEKETTLAPISVTQVSVQMVAGSVTQPQQSFPEPAGQGWRISAKDGSTHITLNASSMSVETTQYGTWTNHFSPWVTAATNALVAAGEPGVVLRLGMRYVNAIFGAALEMGPFVDSSALRKVVVPHLLGFLSEPRLGAVVDAFQGKHLLRINDILSHVQHAMVTTENGEVGLLLDIDTYVERTAAFDGKEVLNVSNDLHLAGLSVFQRCLTGDAWNAIGPTEGFGT